MSSSGRKLGDSAARRSRVLAGARRLTAAPRSDCGGLGLAAQPNHLGNHEQSIAAVMPKTLKFTQTLSVKVPRHVDIRRGEQREPADPQRD